MKEIIHETNQMRDLYSHAKDRTSKEFLAQLTRSLQDTKSLSKQPCVQAFLEDMEANKTNQQNINLLKTKQHINAAKDNFIFSVFNPPYFPSLHIEACFYQALKVDESLQRKYTTKVMPVNIKLASNGFHSPTVVALFPENHIDRIQLEDDLIFYFIDKFVARFFKITQKMILNIMANDFFSELLNATTEKIQSAAIYWVHLHECYHHQGFLPLPQYIGLKTFKPLAGLEELRVDMCSIIECYENKDTFFIAQFILAERLLRYAVEGVSKPNYDAIASQLLFNFLKQHDCIHINNLKLHLSDNIWAKIKEFLETINHIEAGIKTQDPKEVQQNLLAFTKKYTNFNEKTQEFNHINYFKQVKEWLKV